MSNNKLFLLAGSALFLTGAVAFSVTTFAAPSQEVQDAITNKDFSAYQTAVADRDCAGTIDTEEEFAKVVEIENKMQEAREARQNGDTETADSLRAEADALREELGLPQRQGQGNGEGNGGGGNGQRLQDGSGAGTGSGQGKGYGRTTTEN